MARLATTPGAAAWRRLRGGALLAALAAAAMGARAQPEADDITPPSPAQTLGCLLRPAEPLSVQQNPPNDRNTGLVRLKLRFDAPDAPPQVEVLAASARPQVQRLVRHYVESYRLPCLQPQDGAVDAVQEFAFIGRPHGVVQQQSALVPLASQADLPSRQCLVRPPRDPAPMRGTGRVLEHVVFSLHFAGDGTQAPQVRMEHSTAPAWAQERILDWAAGFRMPCRQAGDAPAVLRQHFSLGAREVRRYGFSKPVLGLAEFLGMTEQPERLRAWFDFNTMGCPFKVAYKAYGPQLPNLVQAEPPFNPDRTPFLQWLRERQLHYANEQQAGDLFGRTAVIQVPCGVLDLQSAPDAAAPVSDSPPSSSLHSQEILS